MSVNHAAGQLFVDGEVLGTLVEPDDGDLVARLLNALCAERGLDPARLLAFRGWGFGTSSARGAGTSVVAAVPFVSATADGLTPTYLPDHFRLTS